MSIYSSANSGIPGIRRTKDEAHQMSKSETPAGKTELLVYWYHSFERGPEHRTFDELDIQAAESEECL
jgi:hypothetical protein